jgi:ribosomal protein S18 acetylase RimI-like enzyme
VNEPPGFTLGPLAPSHRGRIARILRSTENFREEEVAVALDVFDESLAGDEYAFVGAFAREALVGFACYGPTMGTDRTYDLYWIAVDRAAHGTGCGSVLLAEVERRLEALHARMLIVETSSRSDYSATRSFYVRRGYAEAARVREFYAPDDDRIILTKRLAGSPREGWGAVA